MFRILVCEESLSYFASSLLANYSYTIAYHSQEIIDLTYKKDYHLYLFHVECFSVLQNLRDAGDTTPCIFIDEYYNFANLKHSFKIGDDYILKPLYLEELAVRIHYHYSKIYRDIDNIISYRDFYFHTNTKQLFFKKEKRKLSPSELILIELFFRSINKPLSKDIFFEELSSSSDGSLRVYISKLKKIGLEITYERALNSYTLRN
jgi:DNA-binding response OmpR family regulator